MNSAEKPAVDVDSPLPQPSATDLFPVVGIGASAGGLEAFTGLLSHLPDDTGMAFVLVQHLDPRHESQLPSLLAKSTSMPVVEVANEMPVRPNRVYVIPPNSSLSIQGGILRLSERPQTHGPHLPIDGFLRSLAEDRQNLAIGVVLSGTGSDGSLGLAEIKGAGGITLAQDEKSAKYSSMPLSAIGSGSVDTVLPPEAIAGELARIGHHAYLKPSTGLTPSREAAPPPEADEFRRILALLRSSHQIDFAEYRDSTIRRRINRRMALQKRDSLADYRHILEDDPAEVEALCRDMLINVTSFFRDAEMFEALKSEVFPQVVNNRSTHTPIRIWVPGCASGQETYSLAIVLLEFLDQQPVHPPIQIFGTDISDAAAIDVARGGLYPENIESQVSPLRLRRFFVKEDGGYRISKRIRDLCVFARQNLAADPPFSKVDLITCRNVLIYLSPSLQQRIIPTFHYALNAPGFLVLGASESIGRFTDLFGVVNARQRIFNKTATMVRSYPYFTQEAYVPRASAPLGAGERAPTISDLQREADRIALGRYAPAAVLVSDDLNVLQYRGRTGPYLEPPPGEVTLNLLRMARGNLFVELRSAIEEARQKHAPVRHQQVRYRGEQGTREIALEVIPVKLPGVTGGGFLIFFEEDQATLARKNDTQPTVPAAGTEDDAGLREEVGHLRDELASTKDYLQAVIDQQSAANEELKSANEEVLSANEELQSTNEELQTTKEELSSTNEELVTLNEELRSRNQEVGQVNDDLTNLLSSMKVPILMLGIDLRIRRFTPAAAALLNLAPSDLGRPITNIRLPTQMAELERRVGEVVASVAAQEVANQDAQGHWYLMRIHPYRTADNRIDGAVVALLDIDGLRQTQQQLQEARDYAEAVVETISEPLLVLDSELRVNSANRSFYQAFKVTPEQTIAQRFHELGNRQWASTRLRELLEEILPKGTSVDDFEVEHDFPHIGRRTMLLNARRLQRQGRQDPLILLAVEDVTERRQADRQRARVAELEAATSAKDRFMAMLSHELRTPLAPVLMSISSLQSRGDLPAEVQADLSVMRRNISLEARLIDDLLDVTRIIQGKLALDLQPQAPCKLLEQAVAICRSEIDARHLQVRLDFPCRENSAGPCAMADAARLQQVFWNLLRNAIKFTPDGGRITLRCLSERDRVIIQVADSGVGIEPQAIPRLFEAFEQASRDTTQQFGGLGLGLAIAKAIVEQHHGTIRAESPGRGHGATFTVDLPSIPPHQREALTAASHSAHREAGPTARPKKLRILVVEDHADTANILGTLLRRVGHETHITHDISSARDLADHQEFDLVISDLGLPDGSGVELMQYLSRVHHLKGIAVTGFGMDQDRAKTRQAGFIEHLVKPINFTDLQSAIARVVQPKPN